MSDSPGHPRPQALTPSYWQSRYEAGDTGWDKGLPAPPLMEFLASQRVSGRVLVPGCGSGHDVRALASQGASPLGLDIAPGALERARSHPKVGNEDYALGDFLDLPTDLHGAFDWIFEHTCFCAISPSRRPDYVQSCLSALKPDGKLLAIFYLNPREVSDESPPFATSPQELDALFGTHFDLIQEVVPSKTYPEREGRELLRLATRRLRVA